MNKQEHSQDWFNNLPDYSFFKSDMNPVVTAFITTQKQVGFLDRLLGRKGNLTTQIAGILGKQGEDIYFLQGSFAPNDTLTFGDIEKRVAQQEIVVYQPFNPKEPDYSL